MATANVVPDGSPQDASTTDLLHHLRDETIPDATAGGGPTVLIGGQTAIFEDFSEVLSQKLPLFIGVVVLLSFLLLMAVFRSIVVPLMASVMNLLSAGAAFGVITAIFQWGWGASLIGIDRTGPIEAFLPVMVFAILFGLSMDYEVFLVSRIYEEWRKRGDNREAVVHGLSATARTITAAAAIMVLVFAAFVLGGERVIMLFGVGLASAVLLDAVVVRSVLVPSLMLLAGKANWWLPAWLDRLHPPPQRRGQHGEPPRARRARSSIRGTRRLLFAVISRPRQRPGRPSSSGWSGRSRSRRRACCAGRPEAPRARHGRLLRRSSGWSCWRSTRAPTTSSPATAGRSRRRGSP